MLDFATLRELSASWVQADAEQRHGDAAWREHYADGSGRSLVLLLEFQSTVDRDMAVRVLRYQGMAFENLRRQRALDDDGALRLLSVVVYSGRARWKGPGGTARVTVDRDGEILRSQPYVLLDTAAAQDDLPADNLVAAVCHLDNARSAKDAMRCAESLARRLSESLEAAERDIVLKALFDWLRIRPQRGSGGRSTAADVFLNALLNREDGMTRLGQSVAEWTAGWMREGREQGIEQAREQSIEEQRAMLCRQAGRKFGSATATALAETLTDVSDPARLELVLEAMMACESGEALIAAVGR